MELNLAYVRSAPLRDKQRYGCSESTLQDTGMPISTFSSDRMTVKGHSRSFLQQNRSGRQ